LIKGKSPDAIGNPIRVVIQDGKAFSLDNRRLVAFNQAGVKNIPIEVVRRSDVAKEFRNKFNSIGGEGNFIVIDIAQNRRANEALLRQRGRIN